MTEAVQPGDNYLHEINRGFALDVISCDVEVQVALVIIVYQEKILFTLHQS